MPDERDTDEERHDLDGYVDATTSGSHASMRGNRPEQNTDHETDEQDEP
ncbi:hypothetical protein [Streptomyces sp. NPDC059072]